MPPMASVQSGALVQSEKPKKTDNKKASICWLFY
jgi:hypothetical protein